MKTLGKMNLTEPMVDLSALATFVECVTELPDPNLVPLDSVFRLVTSQRGYTALHFYKCRTNGTNHIWVDITADPGLVLDQNARLTVVRNRMSLSNSLEILPRALSLVTSYTVTATNFATTHTDSIDGSPVLDKFKKDVLVAKRGGFPASIEDGTEMLSSVDPDGVNGVIVSGSRLGRLTDDTVEREEYYFRMFRVFESGYTMYQDEDPHE